MTDQVTAIVLAAGAGTRMKSSRAKVLHEIAGRSMIEHALIAVAGAGVHTTVAVVGHDREQVSAAISAYDPSIVLAVQEVQNGTGHAVQAALEALDAPPTGTVLVTYGDVPLLTSQTLSELLVDHRAAGRAVTILTAEVDDPTGYGRILRDADGAVTAIREHRDASPEELAVHEINSGILAVDAQFLRHAVASLESGNAQGELYLTDIVGKAVAEGRPVGAHVLEDVWQTEGVNDRAQLARLGRELNRRLTRQWMAEGVTMVDPETTWIDSAVTLARDVTLLPGTQLLGATSVAEGATIGPDTTLRNVEVGENASIIRTHGSDAVIGAGANVGPFAYLRPGAELGEDGKIGTFVEVKNSVIGTSAKVPHLTYVGDATIGEGANIGAGTIFANYDGVHKNRTTIGRHAKTSSNNTFVAPVSVGDGAFTGAGATIRQDVPPGALAVSAGSQRNIEGWVGAKRPGSPSDEAARTAIADNNLEAPGE
ncbi:bifunctional UDP-N-acetylglucosamine diphosphorylase/glucosamine-1-phosphate N-acetyltransferase GlmU [Aeromicrobium wangtongii]|uniref:Bifunctional protein GlmU n=1 Tax=Aeromicrobium wangtongii TaxID=2969247 RepID=A0ABY5MBS3_9ACTN|nr:bifunctional UDP-N-acetylglucosamine diphosphorylase/glucosamine-1-phosphate N-acetyltransferase GlmU [Aeromicrobium wangtongii]MCD9196860.1 bifunctional UDP-N-acetylglucosamine diphosphorylase/glucosamine-1-phosphate N-acetyltransferase GlmU [Aeromicrobium wangtongii]UUP14369.1 bifunctional UDP-N-acetylglucosamine diphosphorylase/glucosamine-1-phosphate N-acetyltransferase GlmU [Aeromicrobium wangtongii]